MILLIELFMVSKKIPWDSFENFSQIVTSFCFKCC